MSWELVVIAWVLPTGIAYTIGRSRDRGGLGLLLGLLLSWLGVVVSLFLPSGGLKCPACAERVKSEARVCRHCGAQLRLAVVGPWQKDRFEVGAPRSQPSVRRRPKDRDLV